MYETKQNWNRIRVDCQLRWTLSGRSIEQSQSYVHKTEQPSDPGPTRCTIVAIPARPAAWKPPSSIVSPYRREALLRSRRRRKFVRCPCHCPTSVGPASKGEGTEETNWKTKKERQRQWPYHPAKNSSATSTARWSACRPPRPARVQQQDATQAAWRSPEWCRCFSLLRPRGSRRSPMNRQLDPASACGSSSWIVVFMFRHKKIGTFNTWYPRLRLQDYSA
jgi:hypothetical protein